MPIPYSREPRSRAAALLATGLALAVSTAALPVAPAPPGHTGGGVVASRSDAAGGHGLADPPVRPLRVEAEIRAAPEETRLDVSTALTFRAERDVREVEFRLSPEIDLQQVTDADGAPLRWRREPGAIRVADTRLDAGAETTWRFRYALPLGMSLQDHDGYRGVVPWYPYALRTLGSSDEFPRYLPVQATVTASLPRPWTLVSVGRLSVSEQAGSVDYRWSLSRPVPVVPLVVDRLELARHRTDSVEVLGFFHRRSLPHADTFVEYVGSALEFYSERLAPYPRSTYTLVETELPPGVRGITLHGLTVLSSRDIEVTSPFPYRILAHEVAHNWWSHAVEFPRRVDGWLREGLATYSALLFIERRYGTAMMREELERSRRVALATGVAEPLDRGFTMEDRELVYPLNYHKSAFVLHMLRRLMGLRSFTSFLQSIQQAHDARPASADEIRRLAEEAHGEDLSWFFRSWVEQAAIPSFEVRYSWTRRATSRVPAYRLTGTVRQTGAEIEGPVQILVRLTGAPPLEHTLWLEPGTTRFELTLPSRPEELLFDPQNDLLYRDVEIDDRTGG